MIDWLPVDLKEVLICIFKKEGDIGPFGCCTRIIGRHGHDAFNLEKLQLVPTYLLCGFELNIKSTKRM